MVVDGPETIDTHPRGPCCAWRKGVACWAAMTWRASGGRYFDFAMQSRPRRRRKTADDRRCGTEIEAAICRRSSLRPDQSSSSWAHSRQSEGQPGHGRCRCPRQPLDKDVSAHAAQGLRFRLAVEPLPIRAASLPGPFHARSHASWDPGRYGRRPAWTPLSTSSNCAIRLRRRTRQHGSWQVRRSAHPCCSRACPI